MREIQRKRPDTAVSFQCGHERDIERSFVGHPCASASGMRKLYPRSDALTTSVIGMSRVYVSGARPAWSMQGHCCVESDGGRAELCGEQSEADPRMRGGVK